jgi:hypothetical protein
MRKGIERTRAEILANLAEQRDFIRQAALHYDAGKTHYAKSIATAASVLLQDGKNRTKSIMTQLGLTDKLSYANSARPLTMYPRIALVSLKMNNSAISYIAHCQLTGFESETWSWFTQSTFKDWWADAIFRNEHGGVISRKGLVYSLRSQDGGAHFDAEWAAGNYREFATTNDATVKMTLQSQPAKSIPDAHLASMRQIGWEIEETFRTVNFS